MVKRARESCRKLWLCGSQDGSEGMSCLAEYAAALAAQNHELQPESSFPMLTLPLSSLFEMTQVQSHEELREA